MEVCRRLQDHYKNGILFVPAADLTRASELTPLLASAFDIALNSEQGSSRGVADWIGDKSMLMVLDNLEQVVAVSGEIAKLIEVCPNLSLVCTSRSPLKIKAEQEYPLHPLALPETEDWETIAASPAVALFTARAQRADRLFELTTENAATVSAICKRLDGMPLAIELAAARIRVLPPDKLLERLHRPFDVLVSDAGDVPERHQTLHSAIEWSYSMLRTSDQVLFRRLAVFDRCFSLEDIETVCYDDPVSSFHAVNALESLLDKALVEKLDKAMRFRMLEPIRDFAREKLHESGEGTFFFQKLLHLGGNTERCPCPNIVSTVRTSDGLDVVTP
jgi:predicted ATPase